MAKKTFNDKLHETKDMPKIIQLKDITAIQKYGGDKMLIAPPIAYDTIMKIIPEGKLITSDLIRKFLANRYSADFTCPLTAGIFINVAARASFEREDDLTPYWRTLKKDGELNEKYPGGIEEQKNCLEIEGHEVIQKGKRYFVKDYKSKLYELE